MRTLLTLLICSLGACNLIFGIGDIDRSVCGDGEIVLPEVCDDGNAVDGDGCNSTCSALTCQVPATHTSIGEALEADCGTIQLAGGTYNESLTIRREVTIEGLADGAVLTGKTGLGVPSVVANMPLTLRRLTMSGGSADRGGGIRATADLTLQSVVVENNTATVAGAGLLVEGANLTATNLTVRGNSLSGTEGGGISIRDGEFTISDSTITANSATSASIVFGTGLHLLNASGTISNSLVSDNMCSASGCRGVGISVFEGTVELIDVQIQSNRSFAVSGSGVGLRLEASSVTFSGGSANNNLASTVASNGDLVEGTVRGGGIHAIDSNLSLSNVSIASNTISTGGAGGLVDGAGINLYSADDSTVHAVSILNCSFEGNLSRSVDLSNSGSQEGSAGGGGLTANNLANVPFTISVERSAFINNNTSGNFSSGAGLRIFGGADDGSLTLTVINTTISGNMTDGEASAQGAGLLQGNSDIDVRHSTIVNNEFVNSPAQIGSGVFATSGTTNVENTIVAANVGSSGDCGASAANNLVFDSASIVGNATGCLFLGTPRTLNPLVGPLADNGGPTQTHSLQLGSPALESGTTAGCVGLDGAALTVDQRGELRNGVCDVGAFEGPAQN